MKTQAIIIALLMSVGARAATDSPTSGQGVASQSVKTARPVVKIEAERLPRLNIPRNGHSVVLVNGEVTVIGGHTTNFIPTATAEYYKDGAWHVVKTAFTHDDGLALPLSSGKVLVAGGHTQNMGIGQSYEAELYDPATHTSVGFASLDTKRSLASAQELDSGRVVIAGNWYHDDCIEMFDGRHTFTKVKDVAVERSTPYILRTAKNNVIIVGSYGNRSDSLRSSVADCLQGEAYSVPLLEEWQLLPHNQHMSADVCLIGDDAHYSYLLPVKDKQGQVAIAKVENGVFSILTTDSPVPMSCGAGGIAWCTPVIADRQQQKAYLIGIDSDFMENQEYPYHLFVLTIDYAVEPASLTLGYTEPLEGCDVRNPILTPDGNVMLIGGLPHNDNFQPSAAVWLLHINGQAPTTKEIATALWPWILLVVIILAIAVVMMLKRKPTVQTEEKIYDSALMQRICELMESQKLYLSSDLKLSDVASALGTNRNYISDCINSQRGCSFTQFVNTYRVEHAKKLLRSQSDMKISEVCTASGFASENTFFRTFKAVTGMTPSEYKA